MAVRTSIYLIRHGQSAGNAEGRFGGHSPSPLSELGHEQARNTAIGIANERITAIYSSDLLRAVQTAQPLAESTGLEIIKNDAFRERHVGVLQGLTFDEAKNQYPNDFYALINRNVRHVITGGESYRQLLDRTTNAFYDILDANRGGRVAIFSHTGTICFLTLHIIGAINSRTKTAPWLVTSNCGINRLEFRGRSNVRVFAINDTRHLTQISGNDAFAAR